MLRKRLTDFLCTAAVDDYQQAFSGPHLLTVALCDWAARTHPRIAQKVMCGASFAIVAAPAARTSCTTTPCPHGA